MNHCCPENTTTGRIVSIDNASRSFTLISNRNLSSAIIFHVPMSTRITNRFGRLIRFSNLFPGMRVQVRHASFMTASIPPQTTAFEIQIID